jgi:hypothetical protein
MHSSNMKQGSNRLLLSVIMLFLFSCFWFMSLPGTETETEDSIRLSVEKRSMEDMEREETMSWMNDEKIQVLQDDPALVKFVRLTL